MNKYLFYGGHLANNNLNKQQKFLNMCQQTANPNLDFSKVVFIKRRIKVEVSCSLHPQIGSFWMWPDRILVGSTGCKICKSETYSQKSKLTQEQFLEKCKQKGNSNLNFDSAIYQGSKIHVEVLCNIHLKQGLLKITPEQIYQGVTPCKYCNPNKTPLTQDEFVKRCKLSGTTKTTDISKAMYISKTSNVDATCLLCGLEFTTAPGILFKNKIPCPACKPPANKSQEQFIEKCQQTASPNLDFSKAVYRGCRQPVDVSCKKHPEQGIFTMRPRNIYAGWNGCKTCLSETSIRLNRKTQEHFIKRCKNTANKHLDLSKAVYINKETKVEVSCKIHPEQVFYMRPKHIYRGQTGCRECLGWVTNQEDFLKRCKQLANKNLDISNAVYAGAKEQIEVFCKIHPECGPLKTVARYLYSGATPCKKCYAVGISQKEQDLADFIKSIYNSNIVLNDRTVLSGKELDIYLPEKQLAIEFNGLYWHSDINKPTDYHYEKFQSCEDKNIRIIQIWEDTWVNRQEVVKHFLTQELNSLPTVDVKDTTITTNLDTKTVKAFLNTYHLTGFKQYNYAIGLKYKNTKELLAVMTFVKTANKGELLLGRYATKTTITGAFNTLVHTAKQNCLKGLYAGKDGSNVMHFIAYTNNETDTGEVYKNNNWQKVESLPISYTYWHKSSTQRISKSTYSIHQFTDSLELQYTKDLNLKQLEELNSLYRCYDSGKVKWRLKLTNSPL